MHVTLHTDNKFSKAGLEQHMAPVLASLEAMTWFRFVLLCLRLARDDCIFLLAMEAVHRISRGKFELRRRQR